MSEDRGIYADIISNDIGGILASIEGEIYGPGVPSLDPGLNTGDSVPVAFILPNSSRQPLLVPRRPVLKEFSQGVFDFFGTPHSATWARQSFDASRGRSRPTDFRYYPSTFVNLSVRPYLARTAGDDVYLASMLNKGDVNSVLEPPSDVGINRCTSKITRIQSNGVVSDVTVPMEIHTMVLSETGILVIGKQWYLGLPGQLSFQSTATALYDFSLNLVWMQGPYLKSPSHELFTGVLDCEPILRDVSIYMLAETVDISEPPMEMIVLSAATGEFIARYPWIYKNYPTRLLANTGDVDGIFATIDAGTIGSEQAYYKFLVQAFVGGRWQHNGYSYAQVTG